MKIFIDIFIGVWAFILGYIWTNHIDKGPDKAKPIEIWQRFPKFILGFVLVFAVSLWLAIGSTPQIEKALPAAAGEANVFRVIFFVLTFFSIGVLSDFRKLWEQGFGKLAAGLSRQPVRLRDLGWLADLLAVLQRLSSRRSRLNGRVIACRSDLRDEISAQKVEPLLPIEKKLIGTSLGLGIVLLIILIAINHFVPVKL